MIARLIRADARSAPRLDAPPDSRTSGFAPCAGRRAAGPARRWSSGSEAGGVAGSVR